MPKKNKFSTNACINVQADWLLLRRQKLAVLKHMDGPMAPNVKEALQGLVHLLDDIQDKAAVELGADIVFGDIPEIDLGPDKCPTCGKKIPAHKGIGWIDLDGKTLRFCDDSCKEDHESPR